MSLKAIAWREPVYGVVSFVIRSVRGNQVYDAQPLTMKASPPEGHTVYGPTFSLDMDHAQQLMDSLWDCGLRPSEGSGSAGALAATQRHLEDMRKISMHKLGIEQTK